MTPPEPPRAGRRDRAVAAAYGAGWRVVAAAPEPLVRGAFRTGADLMWRRHGRPVGRLAANLRRVVGPELPEPEMDRLVRAGVRSYLRYWSEVFRLPTLTPEQVQQRTFLIDEHHLRDALAEGRGVVVALPHMGNWDQAGAWFVSTGGGFTTVAERLRPEALYEHFVQFRESIGFEVVPLTGGPENPFGVLLRRLRAGGLVCLLADRDLTASGVDVDFFGAAARMPAGPAALAVMTGAALLPVTLWYPPGGGPGMHLRLHRRVAEPAAGSRRGKIVAMTQTVADAFAADIAAHPADWHMLQRVWLDDLDPPSPDPRPVDPAAAPAAAGVPAASSTSPGED